MNCLTFNFTSAVPQDEGHITLYRLSDNYHIEPDVWDKLAADIARERTLIHYPSSVLETRWRHGFAGATLHENRIVSYICLAPIYSIENRYKFARALQVAQSDMPEIDVYEFTTAWTAPEWRRYGISGQMRPPLLEKFFHAGALGASGMAGLASPVLSKLGWRIVGWGKMPFTSSLTAVPINDFRTEATTGWRPPGHLKRYEGEHIPLEDTSHPWGDFTYFWVSSESLAANLNTQLSQVANHDLDCWRRAIIDVYRSPEELHRIAFLD